MTTLCHVTNREQSSLPSLVRKIKSSPVGFTPLLQRVTLQKHLRHKLDRETEVIHWEVNRWWKKQLTRSKYYHKGPRIDLTRAFGNIRKYKTLFPEVQDSFPGSTRLLPEVQLFYRKYKTLLPEVQDYLKYISYQEFLTVFTGVP